ncbi:MAG: small ribosomal subunit Rsm22 family protein [Hyphomicrobiales bacterium]
MGRNGKCSGADRAWHAGRPCAVDGSAGGPAEGRSPYRRALRITRLVRWPRGWCHFKTRVQRSRLHMQAKQAIVPFEDEAYGWLAVSRLPVALPQGRIIAPVKQNEVRLDLHVCAEGAVKTLHVTSRDKATYKRLRKCGWGDALPAAEQDEA